MLSNFKLSNRRNTTRRWNPSDSEKNYKPTQQCGMPNYSVTDIDYTFNSHGFRCDNLLDDSDIPILFLGCSYTEGIGLLLKDTWPSLVIDKIRNLLHNKEKRIPLWNLAVGGTGIDLTAQVLAEHIDIVKPKYIFYHLGNHVRRDYCNDASGINFWSPSHSDPNTIESRVFSNEYYAMHQFYRSLTTIDLAARIYNSKIFIFESTQLSSGELTQLTIDFPNIKFIRTKYPLGNIDPEYVKNALSQEQFDYYKKCPGYARDNLHPGPLWQFMLAEDVWNNIRNEFDN